MFYFMTFRGARDCNDVEAVRKQMRQTAQVYVSPLYHLFSFRGIHRFFRRLEISLSCLDFHKNNNTVFFGNYINLDFISYPPVAFADNIPVSEKILCGNIFRHLSPLAVCCSLFFLVNHHFDLLSINSIHSELKFNESRTSFSVMGRGCFTRNFMPLSGILQRIVN